MSTSSAGFYIHTTCTCRIWQQLNCKIYLHTYIFISNFTSLNWIKRSLSHKVYVTCIYRKLYHHVHLLVHITYIKLALFSINLIIHRPYITCIDFDVFQRITQQLLDKFLQKMWYAADLILIILYILHFFDIIGLNFAPDVLISEF